ncbi:hypothetical protein G3I60_05180 [Streptomyces sp. SID13666]|uniref:DUF6415 family natural product biosynthesis protein n=1 Tax=Streptomyces sp. SID13666 TaxID=2706054 RepID=UPI0013BFEDF1|nr:DUF6415 family natural product biosynthesis protein [Streptomyces sp. SID13666]NEA53563.1 hypothetical protein [Streptomyces sp. SID13666]
MSTPSVTARRGAASLTNVPRWIPPPGGRALLERVLKGLRASADLDRIYDALDQALGESAPAAGEVPALTHCLRSALEGHLATAIAQAAVLPAPLVAGLVERAGRALAEEPPADPAAALGHLRRIALAAQDILDVLIGDTE